MVISQSNPNRILNSKRPKLEMDEKFSRGLLKISVILINFRFSIDGWFHFRRKYQISSILKKKSATI